MSSPTSNRRPITFDVQCSSPETVTPDSWSELARKVEDLGFARLTVSDHLDDQLAPVPALMAAANATSQLRIGSLVFCNDYRHPAVLAKEAATLDLLSDGRFDLGIGAGWMQSDYERSGIQMDTAGVRVDRLEEAVQVILGLFSEGPCNFAGTHYRIDGLCGLPKPLQKPHPPLFIGGGGRRVLELAARYANIVGLNPKLSAGVIDSSVGTDATEAATDRKLSWIANAAGDRFSSLEIQVRTQIVILTNDRHSVAESLAAGFGLTAQEALKTPHALAGTCEQIVEDLLYRRERFGITSIGVDMDAIDSLAPVIAALDGR
ncbi:MAG: TIGR03621 family F420-dependent LLM class oxidoreductase [Microthrixaceae bacterium]